jgi:hypothetical protein
MKGNADTDYRKGNIYHREIDQDEPQKETYIKHDWDAIEFEFVSSETEIPLRELASKYQVALSHIGMISSRERWVEKRKKFRNKLRTDALEDALEEQIDMRLEISRTTLDFLKLWRRQANKIGNQDLIKVLELGARASGVELDKRRVIMQDYQDAESNDHSDIQEFASREAERYFSASHTDGDSEQGAGWTD